MFLRLLTAFILVPLVELYLLLQLAHATSVGTTLMIVIVTGVIGTMLARREGVSTWFRFQQALAQGRMPSREIQDGFMIVFAAALLLTPGLLTDAFGFALLVPFTRDLIRRFVLGRFLSNLKVTVVNGQSPDQSSTNNPYDSGFTIDAKAVHRDN